ncbi:hypothetical protein [Streptomyces sp. DW26H14]|uniref:hypothetical protein n=1 Tax=Streptomyces sp. DW26H14 TaxID=3435395 RepID=UPI00403D70B9
MAGPAPGRIAGLAPAALRCDQRPCDLAGDNGIYRAAVTGWGREVVGLQAAYVPARSVLSAIPRRSDPT